MIKLIAPFKMYQVRKPDEVLDIDETRYMLSTFPKEPNVTLDNLKFLLDGGILVDLSDGEYIHPFRLSPDALNYIQHRLK